MDTIGFALEEWVTFPSEVRDYLNNKEEPKWKKATKVSIVVLVVGIFVVFSFYQIYNCYLSYKNPAWTSTEEDRTSIDAPGILLCPAHLSNKVFVEAASGCQYSDSDEGTIDCDIEPHTMSTGETNSVVGKNLNCFAFNDDGMVVIDNPDGFIIIWAAVTNKTQTQETETVGEMPQAFVPMAPHPNNHTGKKNYTNPPAFNYPVYIMFYNVNDYSTYPTFMKPSAMLSDDGTSYILITANEYNYLNGSQAHDYDVSVSSMPGVTVNTKSQNAVVAYISFSAMRVVVWTEYVALDWITVCGIIAGLTGFTRSIYYVLFLIIDKIHHKCTKKDDKKDKEDEEDDNAGVYTRVDTEDPDQEMKSGPLVDVQPRYPSIN